jgi:hypothetical protein
VDYAKTIDDLKSEIEHVRKRHPELAEADAFALWTLLAYLTEDASVALQSLVGEAHDVGVDAIFQDDEARRVYIVQTKYRTGAKALAESRNDVLGLVAIGEELVGDLTKLKARLANANKLVATRLLDVKKKLTQGYRLTLLFFTSGSVSEGLEDEVKTKAGTDFEVEVIQRDYLLRLLADYVDGAAPAVPVLTLPLESDQRLNRYDEEARIQSWIFTMRARDIAKLFEEVGPRLFARNIRGFLGMGTPINEAMAETIATEPERFWYYNNGVTIVCDKAQFVDSSGQPRLQVSNAQVINGQQTTRVLAAVGSKSAASTLVRVIAIPRTTADAAKHFEELTSTIVEATNWQNAIRPSDLMSNDAEQVHVEREFRKRRYAYLRKRQVKGEAKAALKFQAVAMISKEELAQAVAAHLLDPAVVRAGKERLFDTDTYPKVFKRRKINDYLCHYWLSKAVSNASKGQSRRGYAKWLVLHALWQEFGGRLNSNNGLREQLVYTFEYEPWDGPTLKHLGRALDYLFKAAERHYALNRNEDGDILDHYNFYKRRGRHTEFQKFWPGNKNPYRGKFEASFSQFLSLLEDVDLAA